MVCRMDKKRSSLMGWLGGGCALLLVSGCMCCGLGALIVENRDPYAEPGEEIAESRGGAGQEMVVEHAHRGATRQLYTAWLRTMSPSADLQGMVRCHDTTAPYAHSAQSFPPFGASPREPQPGVVYIGSALLTDGATFRCEGRIDAPYTFAGRLVITRHAKRPSDLFGL